MKKEKGRDCVKEKRERNRDEGNRSIDDPEVRLLEVS